MSPNGGGAPSGELAAAIDRDLGGFESFKEGFAKAAATRFGSGWAWLCVHKGGKVEVCSTPNQDNPLMPGVPSEITQSVPATPPFTPTTPTTNTDSKFDFPASPSTPPSEVQEIEEIEVEEFL